MLFILIKGLLNCAVARIRPPLDQVASKKCAKGPFLLAGFQLSLDHGGFAAKF